jgi:putative spermidine/putrescine transport system ATP-binding protein
MVRLLDLAKRKPSELSGGQQQRIALARSFIYDPSVILMDEPLGALDKNLREQMQLEIKRLHKELKITILYVTHDQEEALSMSDRIVLMREGRIEQQGSPKDLYFLPESLFAAKFLGDSNFFRARVAEINEKTILKYNNEHTIQVNKSYPGQVGENIHVLVRPEHMHITEKKNHSDNAIHGTVVDTIFVAGFIKSYVKLNNETTVIVKEVASDTGVTRPQGAKVLVTWNSSNSRLLGGEDGIV